METDLTEGLRQGIPFRGVAVNFITVLAGACIGLMLGGRLPDKIKDIILKALALGVFVIGMDLALQSQNLVLVIGSLALGGIAGVAIGVEGRLDSMGERLKKRIGSKSGTFTRGLVFSSLLFCVGPMTIVGSIRDGAVGDPQLLYVKSLLDGFSSIALASSLGLGVLFSAGTVLMVQGAIGAVSWLLSDALQSVVVGQVITELSAVGGLIILAIGFDMAEIKRMPVANLLPSLLVVIPIAWLLAVAR